MGAKMVTKKAPKRVAAKKPATKATTTVKKTAAKTTDLPVAAVVRIAKANGAERVGSDGAATILQMAEKYIGKLTKEANKLAAHGGRKTLKKEDIEMASKNI
jgi:histone H3/H4